MNIIKGILGLGIGFALGSLGWVLWRKYTTFRTKVAEAQARVAPVVTAVGTMLATAAPAHTLAPTVQAPRTPAWTLQDLYEMWPKTAAPITAGTDPDQEAKPTPEPMTAAEPPPQHAPAVTPEPALDTDTPRLCEVPCPGNFYTVEEGDSPTSIATAALTIAAMLAGCEKGWPEQKVRARAIAFADDPKHQAAYIQLMGLSAWNARFGEHPPVGAQLWLPPLRLSAIFDRSRQWRVTLSTRRWPDGHDRLEPPVSMTIEAADHEQSSTALG